MRKRKRKRKGSRQKQRENETDRVEDREGEEIKREPGEKEVRGRVRIRRGRD